jgi:hypothetical protein
MTQFRIIGDVHGKVGRELWKPSYLDVIQGCEYSVQVGDMGDAQTYAVLRAHVDPTRHRFIGGNHDDYDHLPPHFLGDFGAATVGGVDFFFIRGAYSIDKQLRRRQERTYGQKLWWPQEELSETCLTEAFEEYRRQRPDFVITHTAPTSVARQLSDGALLLSFTGKTPEEFTTRTGEALQAMLDTHQPARWVFGHFHRLWTAYIGSTEFICLPELGYLDLEHPAAPISVLRH